jgi:ribonuclease HII
MRLESSKKWPDLFYENFVSGVVCGIDEVGRGPLAGPVVAAAVIIPSPLGHNWIGQIHDSKKLSKTKRESLYQDIFQKASIGIGEVSVELIDKINILQASHLAMRYAYTDLLRHCTPDFALVDGHLDPKLPCPTQTIIKGDSLSLSIAAASIIAKVTRDKIMEQAHLDYPHYDWINNAGYGTEKHLKALMTYGISPYHRKSFKPIISMISPKE